MSEDEWEEVAPGDSKDDSQEGSEASAEYDDIRRAILAIAETCDGAKSKDGFGFNRNDAEMGHELAKKAEQCEPWSLAEAKTAFSMCCYYWRQLRKLGINSEMLVDPVVGEGRKALQALEEDAKKAPQGAIQKILESPDVIADIATLRSYEREFFEAALLKLRELGVKAREVTALEQAVRAKKSRKVRKQAGTATQDPDGEDKYEASDGGIVWKKQTPDGEVGVKLTNFCAWIRTQIIRDNGVETSLAFEIEARIRERSCKVTIPALEFGSLVWVLQSLGPEAIVFPGSSVRDRARAAIQLLSTEITARRIYGHTGWRKIDGRWVFLHAAGAVGPNGSEADVEVSLEDSLHDVILPSPPEGVELTLAVRATLRLITLGRPEIVLVAFCTIWRAVLGEASTADFTLHFAGPTGAFKSEVSALLQGFFGRAFNGRRLPGSFKSTANANERLLSCAKDIILVIDDFAPCGTTSDVARLHRDADSLLRGVGNRSGRARLRADGTPRPVYTPRALPITTGEDIPAGHSLRARMLVLEIEPGDIDPTALARCQADRDAGVYAACMSAFIKWLAPRIDGLKEKLRSRQEGLRQEFLKSTSHRRVPDIAASLLVGLHVFLEFALEMGAVTVEEAKELDVRAREAIGKVAQAQAEVQASEESTARFLGLLVGAIASGRCHLAEAEDGSAPKNPESWGWRWREVGTGDYSREEWNPLGTCAGWISEKDVYLDPESAFAAAQRLAVEQGTSLPVTARTLWKRLSERGHLASRDEVRGKNLVRKTVVGKRRDVVHLHLQTLTDTPTSCSGPIGPLGPQPSNDKDLGSSSVGPKPNGSESQAHASGPEAARGEPQAPGADRANPSGGDAPHSRGPIGPIGPEPEAKGSWEEGKI